MKNICGDKSGQLNLTHFQRSGNFKDLKDYGI